MRRMVIASLIVVAGAELRAAEKPAAPAAEKQPAVDVTRKVSWDRYAVIPGRNIFLKERPHTFTASGSGPSAPPPPPPRPNPSTVSPGGAAASVLRGVWLIGEEPTAFFENQVTGQVTPVAAGADFEGGHVKTVTLDAVEYQSGGTTRQIGIGYALDGSAPTLHIGGAATGTTTTGSTTPGAPAAAPPSSAEEAALLQKLRERRQKELGK